jgi:hypothetical protein
MEEQPNPNQALTNCPACGEELPLSFSFDDFDEVVEFRCPYCDALFERGEFVCYGPKPKPN